MYKQGQQSIDRALKELYRVIKKSSYLELVELRREILLLVFYIEKEQNKKKMEVVS